MSGLPAFLTMSDAIRETLLALLQSGEGIPISIKLTSSEEVEQLKSRIQELEEEVKVWRGRLNQAEFLYGSECRINDRLLDLLRVNGVRVPRDVFKR